MREQVVVRALGAGDVADYRAIRLAALLEAPEAFGTVHAIEAARPMEEHAARLAGSTVFGAYDGAAIAGIAGLRRQEGPKETHKAFVWGVYVAPAARGAGVGAALMSAVLTAAAGMVEQVTLTVVAENAAAIALYERFGFRRYGVEPRALKTEAGYVDEVLMIAFLHGTAPASA